MSAPLNIPAHTNCTNCGECCGPVPLTGEDVARIKSYIRSHEQPKQAMQQPHGPLECIFRDNEKKSCSIYPVRPMICKLFGVTAGMSCPNGNSAEIDGHPFILNKEYYGLQNDIFQGKISVGGVNHEQP